MSEGDCVYKGLVAWLTALKKLLVPDFCYVCRACDQVNQGLCTTCRAAVRPVVSMPVPITKTKTITVHAASTYEYPLKHLVLKKNYGLIGASVVLANVIYDLTAVQHKKFDLIVPVPLHWTRYAWRWFNQSEVIAQVLHKKTGIPIIPLVKRIQRTKFQAGLSQKQRHANVSQAFALQGDLESYKGKKILIVDDVYTTGTTIKEVSRLLATLNPECIDVVVACRVF